MTNNKVISQGYNSLAENCSSKLGSSSTSQIIINGVDVSECGDIYLARHEDELDTLNFCTLYCEDCAKVKCEFKQLQRKKQECKKLKSALEEIEDIIKNHIMANAREIDFLQNDVVEDYITSDCDNILRIINKAKEQA